MNELVRSGFRPWHLPPKSQLEKQRHQAHVEQVLLHSSGGMSPGHAREAEQRALDALWRTELMTQEELVLTPQMRRLWEEYGLPSQFVRSVIWPSDIVYGSLKPRRTPPHSPPMAFEKGKKFELQPEALKLIKLDVARTLPFLGQMKDSENSEKCVEMLCDFSKKAHREYTQGMSYICVRLMIEFNFDKPKTLRCLERILLRSPTIACLYRLEVQRIKLSVEFILEAIAWDNIPRVWLKFKNFKFQSVDFFFLEWALTMFVKNFGLKISGLVFDLFFLQGDIAIYKSAVAMLSLLEDQILAQPDIEDIRRVINDAGGTVMVDDFIKAFHDVKVSETVISLLEQSEFFTD